MIEVSVIVVMRNEEEYILKCIKSIEKQFDKNDKWEIILVDGMSEDNTVRLVKEYLNNKNINWRILQNPKKILANGWNIGIKNSNGIYVIRPDAHSELGKNYIKEALNTFGKFDDKVVCVGGVLNNIAKGFIGEAIADLFSSKFGVGNSDFRTGVNSLKFTDKAVFGLYKKKIFDEVHTITSLSGLEALIRNKKVFTYGMPFYSGWGLTEDFRKCDRRKRKLNLTQLVAATYILYPEYRSIKTLKKYFTRRNIRRNQRDEN